MVYQLFQKNKNYFVPKKLLMSDFNVEQNNCQDNQIIQNHPKIVTRLIDRLSYIYPYKN